MLIAQEEVIKFLKILKIKLKIKRGVIRLSYLGKNWGICSNSIHFFDLLMFFTKFKAKFNKR